MNKEKPSTNTQEEVASKKRILVAPLDWGLGHATRCVPVIHELIKNNYDVIVGAEGKIKLLLQSEFPQLTFLPLQGYRIRYGAGKWKMAITIALQVPAILKTIKAEQRWLQAAIKEYRIDAVISDNRYGLQHPEVFSVFITHQLHIKSFLGHWSEKILQSINYTFINRFDECWVPDTEISENLAGSLSHPKVKPLIPLRYIGPLTRFHMKETTAIKKHLLIVLSGPEPQRSLLEDILLQQLENYQSPVLLIRGLPDAVTIPTTASHIIVKNHLPASELEQAIVQASFVISRCGYSTIMDLMELNKKSILIPTPGQTEQEYLAGHMMRQHYALCLPQYRFNLQTALQLAAQYPYRPFICNDENLLAGVVKQLADKIKVPTFV